MTVKSRFLPLVGMTKQAFSYFLRMHQGLSRQQEKIRTLFVPSGKFTKDYTGKEKIIDGLRRGMVEQKRCAVKYHSFLSWKRRDYDLDPPRFLVLREQRRYLCLRRHHWL